MSYKLLMFEKLRNYDDNDEWPQPESQVVITFRKTHASKSTHSNSLTWKFWEIIHHLFKTNNHHHPKSSQLFDHPATWTSKHEKPKLWIKSSADPRKTRLDPHGSEKPSPPRQSPWAKWSVGLVPRRRKGDFGWWYLGPKFCTEKCLVQVNSLPVLGPGWKQCWKHPKNAAYLKKTFWWKYITEFLVVNLKLLQCFKLEVWPNSSIDSSCTVQPAQLNMITIYSSSRHGSGENGSLQYLFPFILGYTPNN